jgi:hydrogenase expression/formation protein HypC
MTEDLMQCDVDHECITCGDVAVPLTVVEMCGADALCCDDGGRVEHVAVDFVSNPVVGDRLLVHAGVALERLQSIDGGE